MQGSADVKTKNTITTMIKGSLLLSLAMVLWLIPDTAWAQSFEFPMLQIEEDNNKTKYSLTLQILLLMTVMSLLPGLLLMTTSFARIIIVFSILRQALGTAQTPPNQVLVGVALFLTIFIMAPTYQKMNEVAIKPYMEEQMEFGEAIEKSSEVMKMFMLAQTRQNDLEMFGQISGTGPYAKPEDVPLFVVMPAYVTSELKTAFQIGFLLFLPFLIIDIVVSSTLMALGMMMLSPMLVSLPFKLLLFTLVDGWTMTIGSLVQGFDLSYINQE